MLIRTRPRDPTHQYLTHSSLSPIQAYSVPQGTCSRRSTR